MMTEKKYYRAIYYFRGFGLKKETDLNFLNIHPLLWAASENKRLKEDGVAKEYDPTMLYITDWKEISKDEYEAGLEYLKSLE
jgi:hypothetical protein